MNSELTEDGNERIIRYLERRLSDSMVLDDILLQLARDIRDLQCQLESLTKEVHNNWLNTQEKN